MSSVVSVRSLACCQLPKAEIPREQFPRSILAKMSIVAARMSRRCYEETASAEFKLNEKYRLSHCLLIIWSQVLFANGPLRIFGVEMHYGKLAAFAVLSCMYVRVFGRSEAGDLSAILTKLSVDHYVQISRT